MRTNPVKRTLKAGGVSLGTMVFEFSTPGIGRIVANAGAEFVVYDTEHTGWGMDTLRVVLAATRAADLVPVVRVPTTQYHFLARALDLGAMGLMVPMVERGEQARLIVASAKYAPEGRRGTAFGVAHDDFAGGDVVEKMRSANEETLLIAQIETATGVENVDEIAAVPGIDMLWIGLFDLTTSLGVPAQFSHPDVVRAVERTLAACRKHDRVPAILAFSVEEGAMRLEQGFRCIAYNGDIWLYQQALRQGLTALREAASKGE